MKPYRIFVEKREPYRVETESLRNELNSNLGLNIGSLRLLCVYDLFGFTPELVEKSSYKVFGEPATDTVAGEVDFEGRPYLAVESLPGQFDQRAAAAEECVKLIQPDAEIEIRSARLMIFDDTVGEEEMKKIAHYCINAVESRKKDLSVLAAPERAAAKPVPVLEGFRGITVADAPDYCKKMGLAMNGDDLMEVVAYFTKEGRDPNETELRILDTYWSDHCRHTTFSTHLDKIVIHDPEVQAAYEEYLSARVAVYGEEKAAARPQTLMDIATIGAKYLKKQGKLPELDESEEINACSIHVPAVVNGKEQDWLLMFKNETHNLSLIHI